MEDSEVQARRLRFSAWKQDEVTKALMFKLQREIEEKMVGIVWNSYDDPEIVKGYIRAYQNITNLVMEDLFSE